MNHHFKIPNRDSVGYHKYIDFSHSLTASKKTGIQDEVFFTSLKTISNLDDLYKFRAFDDLVDLIIKLDLLDKYFHHIENQYLSFLKVADKQAKDSYALYYLFTIAVKTSLIKEHFPFFLESIENLICPMEYYDVGLQDIAKASIQTGVIEDYFPKFLDAVDELTGQRKLRAFHNLIEPAIKTGLIQNYFLAFLERIDDLPDGFKPDAIYHLIRYISQKLLEDYRIPIENVLMSLLGSIEKANPMYRYRFFGSLLKSFELVGIIDNHFDAFLEIINTFDQKYHGLRDIVKIVKNTKLLKNFYNTIIKHFYPSIDEFKKLDDFSKERAFTALLILDRKTEVHSKHIQKYLEMLKIMQGVNKFVAYTSFLRVFKITELKKEHFIAVLDVIKQLPETSSYEAFRILFNINKEAGLIGDEFLSFLELITKVNNISKYDMLHEFIKKIEEPQLLKINSSRIEEVFLSFLKHIDNLADYERYHSITKLLQIEKEINVTKKFLCEILQIFPKLPEINSLHPCSREEIYSSFIEAVANADLENEQVFKIWNDKNQHFKKDECY